jgi:hypothetical protein
MLLYDAGLEILSTSPPYEIAHDININTILCIDMYIIVQFFIEPSVCLLAYTCSLGLKGC